MAPFLTSSVSAMSNWFYCFMSKTYPLASHYKWNSFVNSLANFSSVFLIDIFQDKISIVELPFHTFHYPDYATFYFASSSSSVPFQIFDHHILLFSKTHMSFTRCLWSSKNATSAVMIMYIQFFQQPSLISNNACVYFNLW